MMKLSTKLILALVIAGLVAILLAFGPSACTSFFTAKKQAEVSQGQAGAAIESGAETVNTISNVQAADAEADQIHEEGINAIRNAPEGERGNAALAASCRLRHNQHKQRCAALRGAGAGVPAPAG